MPVDESRFERVPALNSMHASTWPFIRATSKNGPLQPSDIQEKEKPVTKNIRAHQTQNEPEFKEMGGLQRPLTDGYMRIFFRTKAYIYIYKMAASAGQKCFFTFRLLVYYSFDWMYYDCPCLWKEVDYLFIVDYRTIFIW